MIPVSEKIGFQHVSIGGLRELTSLKLLNVNSPRFAEICAGHSEEEKNKFRAVLDLINLERVNAQFKANRRLNLTPQDRTITRRIVRTETHYQENESTFIFERNEKVYLSEEEKRAWQPRIDILEKAFSIKEIFSISIIPVNPTIAQTWYDRKSVYQINYHNEPRLMDLYSDQTNAWRKVDSTSFHPASNPPAPVISGFFTPFPTFSSDLATPQYDPDRLPDTVVQGRVFCDLNLNKALSMIENPTLIEKIESVVELFKVDFEAKGVGLVILETRAKVLYLTK